MSRWEFIELLAEHRVPYIDASEEELRQQLEAARPYWTRQEQLPETADH